MTPLHWASYKGHLNCVWLLIYAGFDPLEVDDFGNNAFHHAACGGNFDVLECYLAAGIPTNIKNSRQHYANSLTTDNKCKELIKKAEQSTHCAESSLLFDYNTPKYYCQSTKKF